MLMASSRTTLKILKNLNNYISHIAQNYPSKESTYFEKLIAETFSKILYLPFYTIDNDDPNVTHRLTWQGSIKPVSKAPKEKPDAIAYCYNYYLIIEATLRTGSSQCAKEYAQSIRHCEDFCNKNRIPPKDVFVLLICTELHKDTYRTLKNNLGEDESKYIPIKVSELEKILQASILAFTLRHLDLRGLFHQIYKCIINSSSLTAFSKSVNNSITGWKKDILNIEKNAFIGVKSYEVLRKIGRNQISASEILHELQKHPIVKQYLKIIDEKISIKIIENSLVQQSFARLIPGFNEEFFSPVPCEDFKRGGLRLIDAVMKIK
jgi:hypothetical protein